MLHMEDVTDTALRLSTLPSDKTPVFSPPVRQPEHSALLGPDGAAIRYERAFLDLAPYFRVGMSAEKFLNTFLQSDNGARRPVLEHIDAGLTQEPAKNNEEDDKGTERKSKPATPPEDAFVSRYSYLLSNFCLANTKLHPDRNGLGGMIPGVSIYSKEGVQYAQTLGKKESASRKIRFNPFVCELPVEYKQPDEDPFTVSTKRRVTSARRQALGQLITCAAEILACQHRTHLFTILVVGRSQFRLFRWDSAGVAVTRLEDNVSLLEDFLWRFNNSTPAQRGLDHSVRWATADEETIFGQEMLAFGRDKLGLADTDLDTFISIHHELHRVAVMQVGSTLVLVSRPVCVPYRAVGRRTRGFLGVQLHPDKAGHHTRGFVKDTWRLRVKKDADLEGNLMKLLKERNISDIICVDHGDVHVPNTTPPIAQATRTDHQKDLEAFDFQYNAIRAVQSQSHTHYRIFSDTFGMPLTDFRNGRELVHAIGDVLLSILDAYRKHRLHRDISIGNILLVRKEGHHERSGVLIDWEYSCDVQDHEPQSRMRTGTRPFMSVSVLLAEGKPYSHRVFDDIESLSYVFLLMCVQWMAVKEGSSPHLEDIRDMLFDPQSGPLKLTNVIYGKPTNRIKFASSSIQAVWDALVYFTSRANLYASIAQSDPPEAPIATGAKAKIETILRDIEALDDDQVNPLTRAATFESESRFTNTTNANTEWSIRALLEAFDAARAGPWDNTSDRLPKSQVEVEDRGALVGPIDSAILATLTDSIVSSSGTALSNVDASQHAAAGADETANSGAPNNQKNIDEDNVAQIPPMSSPVPSLASPSAQVSPSPSEATLDESPHDVSVVQEPTESKRSSDRDQEILESAKRPRTTSDVCSEDPPA